jgi:hypothetical protein
MNFYITFVSDMNWTTLSYVYAAAVIVLVTYFLSRIKNIIVKYKVWWAASNGTDVALIGPLHPIWGSLHLVSITI